MDWMEQLFGLNPDGGDGTFEAMVVGSLIIVAVVTALLKWRRDAVTSFLTLTIGRIRGRRATK
jgi:hypothetical protein